MMVSEDIYIIALCMKIYQISIIPTNNEIQNKCTTIQTMNRHLLLRRTTSIKPAAKSLRVNKMLIDQRNRFDNDELKSEMISLIKRLLSNAITSRYRFQNRNLNPSTQKRPLSTITTSFLPRRKATSKMKR